MVFSILGANSATAADFSIDNSLRFNDGDSPYLRKSFGSGGDRRTFTWSGWVKRSKLGSIQVLFSSNSEGQIRFQSDDSIMILHTGESQLITNALFRDPSAWYHIVVAFDSGQGTSSNRVKLYVNGVQITSFTTTQYPDQNTDFPFNANENHDFGKRASATSFYYGGYMTEVHFIDGSAKAATDFGEFDSNGVWIPKEYDGSYGTTGFRLEFKETGTSQNASGIGADTSGNGNHFSVTNFAGTDVTTDTCVNNYAVLNPLLPYDTAQFSEGNLKITQSSTNADGIRATIGVRAGKWYWEVLHGGGNASPGIATESATTKNYIGQDTHGFSYFRDGNKYTNDAGSSYGASFTTGDIIGHALDMDNNQITFYKNGSSQGVAFTSLPDEFIFPAISTSNVASVTSTSNFGQEGSFAGSKTAQGNSDANGYGDFYYSVPSGYYALNTKNLAEFG